jgi:hypothetical protein
MRIGLRNSILLFQNFTFQKRSQLLGILPVGRWAGMRVVRQISIGPEREVNRHIHGLDAFVPAEGQRVGGQMIRQQSGDNARCPGPGPDDQARMIACVFVAVMKGIFLIISGFEEFIKAEVRIKGNSGKLSARA